MPQPPTRGSGCCCVPIASFPAHQRLPAAHCSGKLTPLGGKAFQLARQKSAVGPYPPASLPCHVLLGPEARRAVWPFLLRLEHCSDPFCGLPWSPLPMPTTILCGNNDNLKLPACYKGLPPRQTLSQPALHKPTPHSWLRLERLEGSLPCVPPHWGKDSHLILSLKAGETGALSEA